MDTTKTSLKLI